MDVPNKEDIEFVDWEILPPGWWNDESQANKIRSNFGSSEEFNEFIDRLKFVDGFNPRQTYTGKFGDQGYKYYIFVFDRHVVAECPQYGNAVYVLKGTDNWQSIFSRSRQELRANYNDRMIWIRHTKTWKQRLKPYLN